MCAPHPYFAILAQIDLAHDSLTMASASAPPGQCRQHEQPLAGFIDDVRLTMELTQRQAVLLDSTLRELLRVGVTFAQLQARTCTLQEQDAHENRDIKVSCDGADEEWICVQPLIIMRRPRAPGALLTNILLPTDLTETILADLGWQDGSTVAT
jgi:hypothetical protein